MGRHKKIGADAAQEAAIGHNLGDDEMLKAGVERILKWESSIDGIRAKIKDEKNELKTSGFLKMSVSKAVRDLRSTEE